jgi:hypothetical protein
MTLRGGKRSTVTFVWRNRPLSFALTFATLFSPWNFEQSRK